jgi:TPR repeat protein
MGMLYLDGRGVKKDVVKARELLEKAAKGGVSEAKEALQSLDLNQSSAKPK